ncbi:PspC domain-containing protein [Sphingomonas sabuli]|uniref:PspC domain-containing protein n=1 Tax=Sphingomonas sabuli TaxID=2764186 RepID=A0A7G9L2X7_9SPHN|nr:PspC domain-containing protein [Sphingomonas sabuli]QNM82976.1 PspC domain-containing protein [Sphingomonas sabuli]
MTTAATQTAAALPAARQADETPLPLRSDTLLGICEAVGQELGFNPNWLRVAFSALLLWNPTVIVAAYLGLGVVVFAARRLLRDRKPVPAAAPEAEPTAPVTTVEEQRLAA